ncbi:non-ribosomal peptide synthetase [Sciscionella sediminilitoris]|uniref:non-ribosomal peptide synthetase n=1 Tax=Sciscionella sediminilitoris TaxID=1445613 RepID=UPI0004DF78FE|nr:non-ribosomal peptide synthetase [Sciscionella sp. SE31]
MAPLSPVQQRLWLLAQLDNAKSAYNELLAFELRGPLDRTALLEALDMLAARHAPLRTRIAETEDGPRQLIGPPDSGFPCTVEESVSSVAELLTEETETPFDFSGASLARARIATLEPQRSVLIITLHHIVFDGWSRDILLRELGKCYAAAQRGEAPALAPLHHSYAEHARRQQDWLAGPEPETQLAYWTKQLDGAPALLELPSDRPRPAEQDYRGGRVLIHIDEELTSELRALAERTGVSLYSTILTAWGLLLSRLADQPEAVIGAPIANRRDADIADLMGFFVNTVALRVDRAGAPSGSELLRRTHRVLKEALSHGALPFDRVVEAVNPPRSAAHAPLFQAMFAWVPSMHGLLEMPGISAEPLDIPVAPAKFDLALSIADEGPVLSGSLDYASALFDHETAAGHERLLRRLLTELVRDPERRADELPLLDAAETRALLDGQCRTAPAPALPGGILERFAEQVRAHGDRIAVEADGERIDYASLDRRSGRLAGALGELGIGRGDVVGLHTGRCPELVVGILGVLKAGAAFLPLDPGQPPKRLATMVEDAGAAAVLQHGTEPRPGWLALTELEDRGAATSPPAPATGDLDLAYVIYTSGSTGKPKGVAVTQASVRNLFDQWVDRFGAPEGRNCSAWSGIGFDASVHEILLPLTTGASLHLVPERLRGDPAELLDWMRARQISDTFLPPAYVTWLGEDPRRLHGLAMRTLLTGVESIQETALAAIAEAQPGIRICFGYGPTEATLYSTAHTEPRPLHRATPIGRPVPGTRLYLLDERLRPVPPGMAGEVYLAGACLARGYHGDPGATASRFLADPFVPGERMYRTGDLARWLPDGAATYLGRADAQVKLRGFRIEPGEIEAALRELPGVTDAVVLADRSASGEGRLIAALAGTGEQPEQQWRAALAERLPEYMIPAVFLTMERIPLNRSGKADRVALLERAGSAPEQVNTESPRDHVELALYRIWRDLLLHQNIGITDDFFALGGSSVSAIKVAGAVREQFGRELPVREILLHPTIEGLAALLRRDAQPGEDANLIEFRSGTGRERVVCVHPAGGTAFCYLPLSSALPEHVAVHGIQSPGLNAGEQPLASVEEMAEEYLRLIAPGRDELIVLCGLSYGGLVAHEMGARLARRGHSVSVVLLDTNLAGDPAARAAVQPVELAEFREKLVRFNGMYPGIEDSQIARYHQVYNHNRMTAKAYDPGSSAARLVFLQAVDEAETDLEAMRESWRRRAEGEFLTEALHCGHWDVLESAELPNVAKRIAAELELLGQR